METNKHLIRQRIKESLELGYKITQVIEKHLRCKATVAGGLCRDALIEAQYGEEVIIGGSGDIDILLHHGGRPWQFDNLDFDVGWEHQPEVAEILTELLSLGHTVKIGNANADYTRDRLHGVWQLEVDGVEVDILVTTQSTLGESFNQFDFRGNCAYYNPTGGVLADHRFWPAFSNPFEYFNPAQHISERGAERVARRLKLWRAVQKAKPTKDLETMFNTLE